MSAITPRQARYLLALVQGATKEQAARLAKVAPSTARRWHREPAFQQALSEAVDLLFSGALAQLAGSLEEAVHALRQSLREGTPAQRAASAERLIGVLLKLRTDFDLSIRIERLEAQMGGDEREAS